jgi:hypothetical protein
VGILLKQVVRACYLKENKGEEGGKEEKEEKKVGYMGNGGR